MPHEQETRLTELAHFVRVRRLRPDPRTCGLDVGEGRRRTAGLRREELGHLAGLSGDWIARLEQGRDINCPGPRPDASLRLCGSMRWRPSTCWRCATTTGHRHPFRRPFRPP